jgi:hypothetical protein
MQRSLLSSAFLMKPGQKITTNTPHPCLFFSLHCNDEPPHSSLFSAIQEKKNTKTLKRATRILAHHHPLQPKKKKTLLLVFLGLQETTKSLLAHPRLLVFFLICRRQQWARRLLVISWFFQNMMMSFLAHRHFNFFHMCTR